METVLLLTQGRDESQRQELKLEGSDVDLFLTGSRWSARSRKERRVCRGAYAWQGRRQGAWHAWGAAKQAAGRGAGGRQHAWQGAAGQGLHSMAHARGWRNRAGRAQGGEQAAQVRRKKKREAQEIRRGSGVYIGVVESSQLARQGRVRVGFQVGDAGLGLRGSDCREKKKKEKRAGLLVWAEKVFPNFLFTKKILQIRFEFKLHESKFKSNHKQ